MKMHHRLLASLIPVICSVAAEATPRLVPAAQAKWADLNAVEREVQLQPGSPEKLDSGDCELMSQVKSEAGR